MSHRYLVNFADDVISIEGDDSMYSPLYFRFVKNIFFRSQTEENIVGIPAILQSKIDPVLFRARQIQSTDDTLKRCILARKLLMPDPVIIAEILDYTLRVFVSMGEILESQNPEKYKLFQEEVIPEDKLRTNVLKDLNFLENRFPIDRRDSRSQSAFDLMGYIGDMLRVRKPDEIRSMLYKDRTIDYMFALICDLDKRLTDSGLDIQSATKTNQRIFVDWRLVTEDFGQYDDSGKQGEIVTIICNNAELTPEKNYISIWTSEKSSRDYLSVHLAQDEQDDERHTIVGTRCLKKCLAYNFCGITKRFIADWKAPTINTLDDITNTAFKDYNWVQILRDDYIAKDLFLTLDQYEQFKLDFPATKHYVEGYSQPTRRSSFAESERSTLAGGYDESKEESTDTSFMGIALLAIAGIGAYFLTGKRR